MSYDSRCYDLAVVFLSDEPNFNNDRACRILAQVIQDAIEDWLQDRRVDIEQEIS